MISIPFNLSFFILWFLLLFILLLSAKALLVTYRIASGKWPASAKHLLGIVEWKKEALKILGLLLLAYILTITGWRP